MFAFCPGINQQACGISDDKASTEFKIAAGTTKQTLSTDRMKYVPTISFEEYSAGKVRHYDFCHY